ncbi:MAG: flavodoxin-dependent (E)-4-hydroxy-3-methylbut-2-enyl-diphosphate synthase [Treponema sp.]|nr:flavodoxin-dependent (E)-4-hydroxy-3-methylbut-2-enyl-diphosphate synthase [Treponema sp.]
MSRFTRQVKIGGSDHVRVVTLGGGLPPVIQTMWKERLSVSDIEGRAADHIISRIETLGKMGCSLLRFAVPDLPSAEIVGNLASMVSMPLVADIHFDHKIALRCLDFPIAKIRINPGNIGSREKVEALLSKAASLSRPIRVGVNAGSLPSDLQKKVDDHSLDRAEAMVMAAEREIAIFDEFQFRDVLVSMKASSFADTIRANRIFAERSDVPLHIGVTEAGPLIPGIVRSTAALLALLKEGIGDTIRVSLSDTMEKEVIAGREILGTAGLYSGGVQIISCPKCGRNSFDTHGFTERWESRLYSMEKSMTVAIMGCEVNGPGEAREADLGITGTGNKVLIFKKGKVIRTIDAKDADKIFEEEINNI